MKTIGHDDVVIDSDDEGEDNHGDANPHGAGQHFDPDGKGANLKQKLATKSTLSKLATKPEQQIYV